MRDSVCLDLGLPLHGLVFSVLLKPAVASSILPVAALWSMLANLFSFPPPETFFCLFANSKPANRVAGYFFQAGPLNCFHALHAWLWNTTNKQSPEQKPTQQNILFSLGVSLGAVSHCCSALGRQSQNNSVSFFLPWKLSSGGLPDQHLWGGRKWLSHSLSFLNFSTLAESDGPFPCP